MERGTIFGAEFLYDFVCSKVWVGVLLATDFRRVLIRTGVSRCGLFEGGRSVSERSIDKIGHEKF